MTLQEKITALPKGLEICLPTSTGSIVYADLTTDELREAFASMFGEPLG